MAGEIQQNPGPNIKCPCGQCHKAVRSDSVACDTCDRWYHRKCLGMRKEIFLRLGDSSWHCLDCALPNVSAFLDSTLDTHQTQFDTLRNLSTDSKSDFTDNFVPSPKACSCPNKNENRVDQRKRQTRKPVKINIINNKKANLLHLIDTDKPDVITGSEMWLNNTISSSEIFPPNNVLRSDHSCGGPVVAMV